MGHYHALYDALWTDDRLGPFEGKAFFAYLFSNHRLRPSGIYRATDAQLAIDTGLTVRRVREHLSRLARADRIVRDGSWLLVLGYFKRQAQSTRLVAGVRKDLAECHSEAVLTAFGLRYPLLGKAVAERLERLNRGSRDLRTELADQIRPLPDQTVTRPNTSPVHAGEALGAPAAGADGASPLLPPDVLEATAKAAGVDPRDVAFVQAIPEPFRSAWASDWPWWISLQDGYPSVNLQREASKYMAHQATATGRRLHKDKKAGFRNWISTAGRWADREADRRAVARTRT